jgi:hypothetical protein
MLYTITNGGFTNGRPVSIGAKSLALLNQTTHTFTLANFTTETSPVYSDPEGDVLSYIKVLQLPLGGGSLELSGVPVVTDQIIISANITAGNLKYVSDAISTAYEDSFKFDAADVGSQSLSGLTTGIVEISVAAAINVAPTCVGDNDIAKDYGDTHIFTSANFTTETTPVYLDPEADAPYALKILTLPVNGNLIFNGVGVLVNQEILMTEVDAGLLTYVPDPLIVIVQAVTFTFAVSDIGSKTFTAVCP